MANPEEGAVNTCRSCGAAILWARTPAGRAMPLDANPTRDSNVALEAGQARVLGPAVAAERRARRELLFTSHHATCPQGKRWKEGR